MPTCGMYDSEDNPNKDKFYCTKDCWECEVRITTVEERAEHCGFDSVEDYLSSLYNLIRKS